MPFQLSLGFAKDHDTLIQQVRQHFGDNQRFPLRRACDEPSVYRVC